MNFEKKIFVIFKKMQILQFINDVVFLTNVLNVQSVTSEINSAAVSCSSIPYRLGAGEIWFWDDGQAVPCMVSVHGFGVLNLYCW